MAKRNLKIFYRDKGTVFFSFLGVIIIIGLYLLFLADTMTTGMENIKGLQFILDSWIMGGLIAAASITTSMGAYGVMVDDETQKNYKDFYSSPMKRFEITGGYLISGVIIGIVMSIFTFILAEIFIVANGGSLLAPIDMLKAVGVIILAVLSSSSMVCLLISFIHTSNAFSACSTALGALIGFLVGAYIPIGELPSGVQNIIRFFPCAHAAALLRKIMMKSAMSSGFDGASAEYIADFKERMGVVFVYGDIKATVAFHIIVLLGSAVVFYLLALLHMSHRGRKR